ncbi:MAG: hypothetical protein WAN36_12920, partial [Calditrichia bacterium]
MSNKLLFSAIFLMFTVVTGFSRDGSWENIPVFIGQGGASTGAADNIESQPIYNSDWEWLHPTPQGNNLRYLKVWDEDNWYAMGYSGTFLRTSDGGSSWFLNKNIGGLSSSGFGYNLFGGYFLDMNTGLACGESGTLVRTTDAGLTWNSVYSATTGF